MRRRDVLRSSAGALTLAGLGGVATAAQDDASYTPLGEVSIDGTQEVATTPNGEFAAVAAGDGFAMVDVSSPDDPSIAAEHGTLLDDHEDGPMQMVADVKIDGDRLLVVGPNNPPRQSALPLAALLYDISDPANPEQLDVLEVDHAIHNSFFADGYAYLTTSDFEYEGAKIVDTSGDAFEVVNEFSIIDVQPKWEEVHGFLRSCHDLYVQGDYMYLAQWDAGTFIVDVSDKTSPELVGRAGGLPAEKLAQVPRDSLGEVGIEPPGNAHYVAPDADGTHLYVGGESWDATPDDDRRGASGIDVFDISDKSSPEKLTTIHPPGAEDEGRQGQFTTSHNFSVTDDRLYTSWYYGGVMVHDVSDPANPERLTWWRQPEESMFWGAKVAVEGEFFVAGDMNGAMKTFPDEAGEMADPPGVFTPPEETEIVESVQWETYIGDGESTTTESDDLNDDSTTTAEPTTDPPTTEQTTEMDDDTEAPTETTEDDAGGSPGFGALAAAGGIGLGAARLMANADSDDAEE